MSNFKDPLTFGSADEDLEDLTQHLDATLGAEPSAGSFTLGDADPLSRGADHPATAQSPDPFDALASANKQQDMPYATYGQLVTPQVAPQLSQSAASGAAEPLPADGNSSASSSSQQQQASGPFSSIGVQQPSGVSSGLGLSGTVNLDSVGSIPSPHLPQPVTKDLPLVVTVSEPQRKEAAGVLGMKASHIEYLVTTHSRLPGWSSSDVSVRRRFRDFVTLADVLKVQQHQRQIAGIAAKAPITVCSHSAHSRICLSSHRSQLVSPHRHQSRVWRTWGMFQQFM
eukprot:GHUV01016579.1.p1 GENE.GHUV01016579.1~~GHUV01016579.1.p1  ORF type:complete len:284 (+),score=85.93 GHUV01016579.1:312-1163(+)